MVGADGSASRIGAHVGVRMDQVDLGLEAEIPVPESVAEDWAGRVLVDWGPLPGSYGWVFPKGDTLTVGVISARGEGAATKRYLDDFIGRLGLAGFEPRVSSGHLTRCRAEDSPLSRGRVLVCGDAAGLLEPWTREGISFALRSGRLAGEWAVRIAEAHDAVDARRQALNYAFAIKAGLGVEMAVGRRLLRIFSRRPGVFHAALTGFRPAWNVFARFARGATSLAEVVRVHPLARRALDTFDRREAAESRAADGASASGTADSASGTGGGDTSGSREGGGTTVTAAGVTSRPREAARRSRARPSPRAHGPLSAAPGAGSGAGRHRRCPEGNVTPGSMARTGPGRLRAPSRAGGLRRLGPRRPGRLRGPPEGCALRPVGSADASRRVRSVRSPRARRLPRGKARQMPTAGTVPVGAPGGCAPQSVRVSRKTGWRSATARISSSEESGPTSKNAPTSHFHLRR